MPSCLIHKRKFNIIDRLETANNKLEAFVKDNDIGEIQLHASDYCNREERAEEAGVMMQVPINSQDCSQAI